MELRVNAPYRGVDLELRAGTTTVGLEIPEERKAQMLADFPEIFEELGATAGVAEEVAPEVAEELAPVVTEEADAAAAKTGRRGKKA